MIKITVADQIRAPGQDWVITSKYWAEARLHVCYRGVSRCNASRVTCNVIAVIAIVRNPSVILTFLIFTPCYLVVCKEIFLGNNAMQSCVMCLDPKQGTDGRAALGNVWVIRFNKSDKITSHVTFVFCGCHQHGLIWLLDSWLCVWWLDALYISFYCLLMRTEFK